MDQGVRKKLYLIILGGLAFRLALALGSDNFNHPDELFQALEQAHRFVFGYGFIPWEFQFNARSYLLPGMIAILLYPFKLLSLNDPDIYIPGLKVILAFTSLIGIWLSFDIGKRLKSTTAGLWAAFFYAFWYDIAYFSIKPLSEVWAALFFLAAIKFILSKTSRRNTILAAVFLVLTAAFRISYVPAAAFAGLYYMYINRDTIKVFLTAALAIVLTVGIFEWLTVGAPFASYYNLYQADKTFFLSGTIGATFGFDYLVFTAYSSFFLIWLFILVGSVDFKRNMLLIIAIIITLISHILLPVKGHEIDYRHIYLVVPLAFILGGIVLSGIVNGLRKSTIIAPIFLIVILAMSTAGAFGKLPFQGEIYKGKILDAYSDTIFNKYDILKAYLFLNDDDDLIGLYDKTDHWYKCGGFYYLHKDIPVYFYTKKPPSPAMISHFMIESDRRPLPGFKIVKSFGKIDIYKRDDLNYNYPKDESYDRRLVQPNLDLR